MAIRNASKFRFLKLATAGVVGVMTFGACSYMSPASRGEGEPVTSSTKNRSAANDEWAESGNEAEKPETVTADQEASVSDVKTDEKLRDTKKQPDPTVAQTEELVKMEKQRTRNKSLEPLSGPTGNVVTGTDSSLGQTVGLGGVGLNGIGTGKGTGSSTGEIDGKRGKVESPKLVVKENKPVDMPSPEVVTVTPPPPPMKDVSKQQPVAKTPPVVTKPVVIPNEDGTGDAVTGALGNTYKHYRPNPWVATAEDRFSTFSVDVDTASYTQARRFINSQVLPPMASVRVEEFVNYFNYQYAPPKEGAFTVHLEGAPSPYTTGRHLVKIGIKGKVLAKAERKQANLVFLVDTSGSMSGEDRLELAKQSLKVMVDNLNENDTVALVTYAGSVRDVLPPTPATQRTKIFDAIDALSSGGGTSMGSGVELAYKHAVRNVSSRSISRVVVLTDGDTNIGQNQTADAMLGSIKNHVEEGVTLTMVGFGMGNYRDTLMEKLADAGNGNCFYIDSVKEAKRVFQEKLAGTLEVIAKDVKLQVEFHPDAVASYRLVGYENRDIADKDFRNDKVDAGEIGAGHTVTALYEVQLTGKAETIATVRVRAKEPSGTTAKEQAFSFGRDRVRESIDEASADLRFAAAVAGTADILRGNPQTEGFSLAKMEALAKGSVGDNADRQEFVKLVQKARLLVGDVNVAAR